ncbi:MAG TPA: SPFH domain-containing protein [Chloroflexia bacterium]|nr:SPFH domain-containing protein [Chloroflexia bacterium]
MAILSVVEFLDPTGRTIVHREPPYGSGDFNTGSQAIVRESQTAVFFRDGKALDVLGPGRHTLSTQNIPLLSGFINLPFGGNSPFKAEVYFVNMADLLDMKWGTSEPVVFRDSELGMVRLRAFGTYAMAVADPQQFVNKIAGTQGIVETAQIADYLRNVIVSRLNDTLGQTMTTLLDLARQYNALGAAMKANVADDFANLGLQLKQFFITSVTPPDEVQKMMDQRSSMGALGDMNKYMQFQAAQAMGSIGQGGGGGGGAAETGMGLGAGAGLGLGMAQMIGQAFQNQNQQQQQAPQYQQQPPPPQYPQQAPAAQQQSTANVTPATAGGHSETAGGLLTCPNCHAQVAANSKFCPECGYNMLTKPTCPNCHEEVKPGAKFCANCGTKMG